MTTAPPDPDRWRPEIERRAGISVYPRSIHDRGATTVFAATRKREHERVLGTIGAIALDPSGHPADAEEIALDAVPGTPMTLAPWTAATADWLRAIDRNATPTRIDNRPSFGFGDRLARATPGHLRAVRDRDWFPVPAQQSIREMTRTGRTPREVMDDALWGMVVEGFAGAFGADADHLKTTDDIDRCVDAGFRLFTIDPGDHVDDEGTTFEGAALAARFGALPWDDLEDRPGDCRGRFLEQSWPGGGPVTDEALLTRATVKYGRAIAHTAAMARHLDGRLGANGYDLEMSVDETEQPTSPLEHYYIAAELSRLGVEVMSIAPRFVGRFEKGIDYIGDATAFEESLRWHAAIANEYGGYRISLHSGSDKFTVYPIARRVLGNAIHVKTAGTSYLEAVRALARCEPRLFREILEIARARYEIDKATYHVSADLARLPADADLGEGDLPGLLDDDNARQILHVTYGSIVGAEPTDPAVRDRFFAALDAHEDEHWACVETHLRRHLDALCADPAND